MKYRKKTDALEASQWFPPGELNHVPNPLVHKSVNSDRYYVTTEHGSQCQVLSGDWVVAVWGQPDRGKVVAADTFAAAWEPVPESAAS